MLEWLEVKSITELKKLGNFRIVKKTIKDDLCNFFIGESSNEKNIVEMIKINSSSWDGLYNKIVSFKHLINQYSDKNEKIDEIKSKITFSRDDSIEYFKTQEDELIFYLLEMDGKKRSQKLFITKKCFTSESEAKKWRNKISKKIHPDKTKNKNATKASAKLNQLYKEMIGQ